MSYVRRIWSDLAGLYLVGGPYMALRWLAGLILKLPVLLRQRNLESADKVLGGGPFRIKTATSMQPFLVAGEGVLSGIREMYARNMYLKNGLLEISDGHVVVDLGANVGLFTMLALSHGSRVRVVSVEPNSSFVMQMRETLASNAGFGARATILRGFVGEKGAKQDEITRNDIRYADAPWLSETDVIDAGRLTRIDFLKCDIEGGEFGLIKGERRLLSMCHSLAIEIHAFGGDVTRYLATLEEMGFVICSAIYDSHGNCVALGRRS